MLRFVVPLVWMKKLNYDLRKHFCFSKLFALISEPVTLFAYSVQDDRLDKKVRACVAFCTRPVT